MFVKNPNLGADPNLGDFTVHYYRFTKNLSYIKKSAKSGKNQIFLT